MHVTGTGTYLVPGSLVDFRWSKVGRWTWIGGGKGSPALSMLDLRKRRPTHRSVVQPAVALIMAEMRMPTQWFKWMAA